MGIFHLKVLTTCSIFVFFAGVLGLSLNRHNLLIMLMSIELMLLSVNLNFIFFSVYYKDMVGQLFALYILTVAAAESAIGLSIFTIYYKNKQVPLLNVALNARR
jgi:NADH-quinone oxidoreductase subunit K